MFSHTPFATTPPPNMEQEKISNFLQDQRDAAADDLQHYFLTFEDYWERKLWHELTDILVTYYNEPQSVEQRIPIYNNFIKSFADKINQLKLVTIGLSTAAQCKGTEDESTMPYMQLEAEIGC